MVVMRQVIHTHITANTIYSSIALQQFWLEDQLYRQASFCQMNAHSGQLELINSSCNITSLMLPSEFVVRPLSTHEMRMRQPSGELVVYSSDTKLMWIELPTKTLSYPHKILSTMSDRGPIIACTLHDLQYQGLLIASRVGWFHGLWNGLKNTMKHTAGGNVWQAVLGLLVVSNTNYYPFRSSQAYDDKKDALSDSMSWHSHNSESFHRIRHDFAAANGHIVNGREDEMRLFNLIGSMPSFNAKGELLKLMR